MSDPIEQLVSETIELTGATAPDLLGEDSPALAKPASGEDGDFYLIGLIGGKDVGKSSFVNALVQQKISEPTSHGAGTEIVVAYAHREAVPSLRDLLEREVPGRFRIQPHDIDRLRRQVLLDLPDIDSIYGDHVQITRTMLRHMLFPIWIQSVEKYADQQPQKLLARVAEGNDPSNFIFCLNKADQIVAREGAGAAAQLRDDYAARISRLLKLPSQAQVHLISAVHSDEHDFPGLRSVLAQEKSSQTVQSSRELAGRQHSRTLLDWLDAQQLAARVDRADRLLEDAQELAAARIGVPVLEDALPALADDPGYRLAMIEPVMTARLSRWPIVNVVHTVLLPVTALLRRNLAAREGNANVDAYLAAQGQSLAAMVQTTFAQLQQSHPSAGALYRDNKLWEDMPADAVAMDLRRRIASTIDRQRAALVDRVAGKGGIISPVIRFLLTIGAALWFPIIQPLLAIVADQGWAWRTLDVAKLSIQIFSAIYLLQSVGFLLLYFLVLWAILRWHTQRRAVRLIERWQRPDAPASLSFQAQVMEWIDELLEPIRAHRDRLRDLAERVEKFRAELYPRRDAA